MSSPQTPPTPDSPTKKQPPQIGPLAVIQEVGKVIGPVATADLLSGGKVADLLKKTWNKPGGALLMAMGLGAVGMYATTNLARERYGPGRTE